MDSLGGKATSGIVYNLFEPPSAIKLEVFLDSIHPIQQLKELIYQNEANATVKQDSPLAEMMRLSSSQHETYASFLCFFKFNDQTYSYQRLSWTDFSVELTG